MNERLTSSRRHFLIGSALLPFDARAAFALGDAAAEKRVTVHFFGAGSDRRLAAYRAPDLSRALPNPLVVEAGHPWPAIFLDAASPYRIAVQVEGELAREIDPFPSEVQDPTFLQAGNGAKSRPLRDKLGETLSVQDFGAFGDGKTDDTLAVANAVLAAARQNKSLVFPAGTYCSSRPFDFSFASLSVRGEGIVVLRHTGGSSACVIVDFTAEAYGHDNELSNLIIEGSGAPHQDGLFSRHALRSLRRNLWVRNVTGRAFNIVGEVVTRYEHCGCSNSQFPFSHHPTHSLFVRGSPLIKRTTDVTFANFVAEVGTVAGVDIDECDRTVFDMGTSEGMGRAPQPDRPGATGVRIGAQTSGLVFDGFHNELNTGGDFDISGKAHRIQNLIAASRADHAPYEAVKSIVIRPGCEGVSIENVEAYVIEIQRGAINTRVQHVDCQIIADSGTGTLRFDNRELYRSAGRYPSRSAGNVEHDDPLMWDWYQQGNGQCRLGGAPSGARPGTLHYTRNGNIVTFDLTLRIAPNRPLSPLQLAIATDLAWPAANETPVALGAVQGLSLPEGCVQFAAYIPEGTSEVQIVGIRGDGGAPAPLFLPRNISRPASITLAGSYRVAQT